jgi:hypothetical protein
MGEGSKEIEEKSAEAETRIVELKVPTSQAPSHTPQVECFRFPFFDFAIS